MQETCHLTAQQFLTSINSGNIPMSINRDHTDEYIQEFRQGLKEMSENQQHPYKHALKFSVVRNPWDRFLSIYHYHKDDFGGLGTFEDFCKSFSDRSSPIITGHSNLCLTQTEYLSIDVSPEKIHCLSEHRGHVDALFGDQISGLRYANSDTSFLGVDYIGRFENLKKSVKEISQKLLHRSEHVNFCLTRGLTHHEHQSPNSPKRYHELYQNMEEIYTVFDYYYADINNFGYSFSGASNCMITEECRRRYEEENAT